MKTYILKKDLPDAEAGAELILNDAKNYYVNRKYGKALIIYPKQVVEDSPEWFELVPKQPQESKLDEIIKDEIEKAEGEGNCSFYPKVAILSRNIAQKYASWMKEEMVKKVEQQDFNYCTHQEMRAKIIDLIKSFNVSSEPK